MAVPDKDELRRRYLDEGQTVSEIARNFGVSERTVARAMDAHAIARRPHGRKRPAIPAEDVLRQYVDEGRTISELAEAIGVGYGTVRRALVRLQVARRSTVRRRDAPLPTDFELAQRRYLVRRIGGPQTARILKVPKQRLYAQLHIKARSRGQRRRFADDTVWERFAAEVASGASAGDAVRVLAEQYACSARTIWRSLERMHLRQSYASLKPAAPPAAPDIAARDQALAEAPVSGYQ